MFYISFYISRYHFGKLFRNLFNIVWKKIFITDFPFSTDSQVFVDASFKSKSPHFLLNKNVNFSKNKRESKMENTTQTSGVVMNLKLQLIQESQIKTKTVMSWSLWAKKRCILCNIYFVCNFFIICVFSQYIVYQLNFKNKYTFRSYQKTLPHTIN